MSMAQSSYWIPQVEFNFTPSVPHTDFDFYSECSPVPIPISSTFLPVPFLNSTTCSPSYPRFPIFVWLPCLYLFKTLYKGKYVENGCRRDSKLSSIMTSPTLPLRQNHFPNLNASRQEQACMIEMREAIPDGKAMGIFGGN